MISRTRQSPGIELHEIDRSQYDTLPDNSIVGTTSFIAGFSDKGKNYIPQRINSMTSFEERFGLPTNEIETYFYYAAQEIISRGGVFIGAKLPYDNISKDSFLELTYKVSDVLSTDGMNVFSSIDKSLTSYLEITSGNVVSISLDDFDKYKTESKTISANTIKIVAIDPQQYGKIDVTPTATDTRNNCECLGIMPVITTVHNAMFYQGVISSETAYTDDEMPYTIGLSAYTPISDAHTRYVQNNKQLSAHTKSYHLSEFSQSDFTVPLSSNDLNDDTVSKQAISYFPIVNYVSEHQLENEHMKHIGVVVFKVIADTSNDITLNFIPVESFVGSLDKKSKNKVTGASDYIGKIVNDNSSYINIFSNIRTDSDVYEKASMFRCVGQDASILGWYECECVKSIDYVKSIVKPLTIIFDKIKDPNMVNIDLMVDAGITNVAQYVKDYNPATMTYDNCDDECHQYVNAERYPFIGRDHNVQAWKIDASHRPTAWYTVMKMFDDFCKNVRKDCMFIADVIRPFCLDGNEKIVRDTNIHNTIQNSIIPNLKYLTALNSSYSAGYSNWMYVQNPVTSEFFWCPPSVKAAGVYTYTDAYYHTWDAPAGTRRGTIRDAVDIAFNPMNDDAGKIYQHAWNYAVNYPLYGVTIEGQKTFQLQKTALDRVNVRRLMLYLEKRVCAVARQFLYEGNTVYNRQRFVDFITPLFDDAVSGAGILDYAIRCDDTLNTPDVIDNNEMRCVIAIRPVKSIEWIRIDLICGNQRASVSEEVMK